jgi:hypothetical protein
MRPLKESKVSSIRGRDRDALLQALRAGVVPRTGQQLIQVGRSEELKALIADIDRIADGSAVFRLIIGEYGSGKTFFLNLVRAIALEKRLVVANADLNPDRRLHSSSGQARSLYVELTRNLATRSRPEGGAIAAIVEKFISGVDLPESTSPGQAEQIIRQKLAPLLEMVGGFDFTAVIAAYWRGHESDDDILKTNALRWLRGEFGTKTEAREALGVRGIIDDASAYDLLKLLARFVRLAGYQGLLICLDELVNLYKLSNTQARNANYEQILRILNDVLQTPPEGFGIILGGTPEFLLDARKGLYSYPALQSRLAENTFARGELRDNTGPVLRLGSLTQEELFVLLQKLRHVYAFGDPERYAVPDEALEAFMKRAQETLGESYFRTPRTTITSFVNFLAVLEQNPSATWHAVLKGTEIPPDEGAAAERGDDNLDARTGDAQLGPTASRPPDDEFATFKL